MGAQASLTSKHGKAHKSPVSSGIMFVEHLKFNHSVLLSQNTDWVIHKHRSHLAHGAGSWEAQQRGIVTADCLSICPNMAEGIRG